MVSNWNEASQLFLFLIPTYLARYQSSWMVHGNSLDENRFSFSDMHNVSCQQTAWAVARGRLLKHSSKLVLRTSS